MCEDDQKRTSEDEKLLDNLITNLISTAIQTVNANG